MSRTNKESILPDNGSLTNHSTFKFIGSDWIYIYDLGKYGFDEEIIAGFMKHEIMPAPLKYKGKLYVPKFAIQNLINKLLKSAIKIYAFSEEMEQKAKELEDQIEKDTAELLADGKSE